MTSANKLSILHISDGKSGHDSAALNIIHSLERVYETKASVDKIEVKLKYKFLLPLMRTLINHTIFQKQLMSHNGWIEFFYELNDSKESFKKNYNYIISGGGDTGYINAFLGTYYKTKNIYASRLRGLNPKLFWLLPTIYPNDQYPNTIYTEFSPSNKALSSNLGPRDALLERFNIKEAKPVYLLLFGGNGAGYTYHKEDLKAIIEGFIKLLENHDALGIMSTSRRTGYEREQELKEIIGAKDLNNRLKYCVFFNHKPEYIMQEFLFLSDGIFVTEDSGAMLIETLLTNKPVCTIKPKSAHPATIYKTFLNSKAAYISKSIMGEELSKLSKSDLKPNTIPSPIDTFDVQLKNFITKKGS
jgi:hypothetical protein